MSYEESKDLKESTESPELSSFSRKIHALSMILAGGNPVNMAPTFLWYDLELKLYGHNIVSLSGQALSPKEPFMVAGDKTQQECLTRRRGRRPLVTIKLCDNM